MWPGKNWRGSQRKGAEDVGRGASGRQEEDEDLGSGLGSRDGGRGANCRACLTFLLGL